MKSLRGQVSVFSYEKGGMGVLQTAAEWRNVRLDDCPDELEVHREVAVDDPVSQADDLLPVDVVDGFREFGREMSGGLAAPSRPAVYRSIRAIASSMSSTSSLAERLDKESLGTNCVPVA
jgi:hypothetical protein